MKKYWEINVLKLGEQKNQKLRKKKDIKGATMTIKECVKQLRFLDFDDYNPKRDDAIYFAIKVLERLDEDNFMETIKKNLWFDTSDEAVERFSERLLTELTEE